MWPALPAPEYYGGSAPPAPFGWHRAYPPPPPWLGGGSGTDTDGSHVHCCPVDGLGTRLCPCGIAMATPQTLHHGLPAQAAKTRTGVPRPVMKGRVRTAIQPTSTGFELAALQEA